MYFHPFTLVENLADEHVPHLGALCKASCSWHQTLAHWFDGRILCQESKRHVDNFLSVTRARPQDDVDELHSDDQFSDEELLVNSNNFAEVVQTRMGVPQGFYEVNA